MQWPMSFYIAHRGASAAAPENTISALKKAKAKGASSVEFDVQLTRDQKPIIFHDDTLSRTTNGRGRVCDTDFAKIKMLDAGSWFSPEFIDERVPSLQQWLETAASLSCSLNLEMKCHTKKECIVLADLVIDHIKKYWPLHSSSLLISSVNLFALKQITERSKLPIAWVTEKILLEKEIVALAKMGVVSVHQLQTILTEDYIALLHAHDLRVLAYTVNDLARANELKAMGVDGIFSDLLL